MSSRVRRLSLVLVATLAACGGGGAAIGPAPVTTAPAGPGVPAPGTSAAPGASAAPGTSPSPGTTFTPRPGASGGAPAATPTPAATGTGGATTSSPIKHVVIIIQENRTFDNLFHGFSMPNGRKADYADFGYDRAGNKIALHSVPLSTLGDPGGSHQNFLDDYDGGKNDGFKDVVTKEGGTYAAELNYGYAYVQQTDVQPYWDMASNGALAERFFHGVQGPTWPSHLMFAAGSTTYDGNTEFRAIDNPSITTGWGCEDPNPSDSSGAISRSGVQSRGPYPCLSGVTTIVDLLQNAKHTWKYYSGIIPAPGTSVSAANYTPTTPGGNLNPFASYKQIYFGPTWSTNTVMPETRILTDAPTQTLADVTYVVPEAYNSDHSNGGTQTGPQWVASVVNAIGQSANWNSTAIFVTWDDYGGWFDHVPPPQIDVPFGLSFRIPLICISPYAKHGQIVDTQYEPGSILKYIEENFGLPSLGTSDARANSVRDMLDYSQTPAPFKTVATRLPARFFITHPLDLRPVDPDR